MPLKYFYKELNVLFLTAAPSFFSQTILKVDEGISKYCNLCIIQLAMRICFACDSADNSIHFSSEVF